MLLPQEQTLIGSVSLDVPWKLITQFSTQPRESPGDVAQAASLITQHLTELGIPHEVHRPRLFLSLPQEAHVRAGADTFNAKPMAMSAIYPEGLTAPLVYQPSQYAPNADLMFSSSLLSEPVDVQGKIVVTEGFGMPGKVRELERQGALGVIAVNPGERAHWGICTDIWGTPDLRDLPRKPQVAVVNVNRPDGEKLIELARQGAVVTLVTRLEEGWFESPIPVVTIPGQESTQEFVLLHGHYDAWDVGVGDNAVGDATLLEVARVLWQHRHELRRSVRIAWWPGHSTGRYAGSTWYADHFALDLNDHCVAQINCDSPGCRWATVYEDVSVMSEALPFAASIIEDVTGQTLLAERPVRAGDYSFNNIGLTGYFMLLSTMPADLRAEKGYYAVGGCGGNIAWHTEDDQLEVADRDILLRDIRIYLLATYRTARSTLNPFDYRLAVNEMQLALTQYASAAQAHFDFTPTQQALADLDQALQQHQAQGQTLHDLPLTHQAVRTWNEAALRIARQVVRVNYSLMPAFYHDPADHVPPLPDLAVAEKWPQASTWEQGFILTQLTRGQNRVVDHLRQAAAAARSTGGIPV